MFSAGQPHKACRSGYLEGAGTRRVEGKTDLQDTPAKDDWPVTQNRFFFCLSIKQLVHTVFAFPSAGEKRGSESESEAAGAFGSESQSEWEWEWVISGVPRMECLTCRRELHATSSRVPPPPPPRAPLRGPLDMERRVYFQFTLPHFRRDPSRGQGLHAHGPVTGAERGGHPPSIVLRVL
eukprot:gene13766-biopygen519